MSIKTRKGLAFSAFLFLVACSMTSATLDSYVDANYSSGQIKRVVVLPITNTRLTVGQSTELNRAFTQTLHQRNPSLAIVGSSEAVVKLNEANLANDWAVFLANYSTSGIPDTKTVDRVGSALNVDAIIQGSIVHIFQQDSMGWSYPITRVSVRYTMIGVKEGKVLWELTGEGKDQPYGYAASPIFDAIKIAVYKILDAIPFYKQIKSK